MSVGVVDRICRCTSMKLRETVRRLNRLMELRKGMMTDDHCDTVVDMNEVPQNVNCIVNYKCQSSTCLLVFNFIAGCQVQECLGSLCLLIKF